MDFPNAVLGDRDRATEEKLVLTWIPKQEPKERVVVSLGEMRWL